MHTGRSVNSNVVDFPSPLVIRVVAFLLCSLDLCLKESVKIYYN
jgi:hypothetical protein